MKNFLKRLLHFLGKALLIYLIGTFLLVIVWRWVPVIFTPYMLRKTVNSWIQGNRANVQHHWVSIEKISPHAVVAVVASEDNLFMTHHGFSTEAIKKAIKMNKKGKKLRGASSISQQTAKNLFTFGSRTWFRKCVEAYFTILIEAVWNKERIMEVYLNSIEMGKGIYGIEACAQQYFGCHAVRLNQAQAALIAAALPNPIRYNIARPSPYMRRRQQQIMYLMPKMRTIEFLKRNASSKSAVKKK